ncbi:MAG TPA: ABC transporter ATP-binding protein [Acidimicrobiales bacterium]|nr:ABC transporter ATP-binding protein [Acidimicrobiales bacterium]
MINQKNTGTRKSADADSTKHVVDAIDVVIGYGGDPIVNGVTMSVSVGEIAAIVGPNGAGKSTLAKGIVGLLKISQGLVKVNGQELKRGVTASDVARMGLAYVPQSRFVFPRLTVQENLEMGGYSLRRPDRIVRINMMLEKFPILKPFLSRIAGTLSGGEQRILGIARALMVDASGIVLDEPTAALSPQACDQVWSTVEGLRSNGLGIIVIEQRTNAILEIADRGYVLVSGACVATGSGRDLLHVHNLGDIFLGKLPSR